MHINYICVATFQTLSSLLLFFYSNDLTKSWFGPPLFDPNQAGKTTNAPCCSDASRHS